MFSRVSAALSVLLYFALVCVKKLAEPLEVYYLALSEEFHHIVHVGVVGEAENIVIGGAGFLLCRQVLHNVGDRVALALDIRGGKGNACGAGGINGV